jgi:hypothetical protein
MDPGLTAQARLLLGRTALSGDVRLGDGVLAACRACRCELEGRAHGGANVPSRCTSNSVGRGLTAEIASLSARDAVASWQGAQFGFDALAATLALQLLREGSPMRFVLDLGSGKVTKPRFASR